MKAVLDKREDFAGKQGMLHDCLRSIMCHFGHNLFTIDQYLANTPIDTAPAEWHGLLIRLCQDKLVRILRKSWGERLYQIPADAWFDLISEMVLKGELFPEMKLLDENMLPSTDDSSIGSVTNVAMEDRLFDMLLEIEREPVKLDANGTLTKKSMTRLLDMLFTDSSETSPSADMSRQLVLECMDIAWRLGLIVKEDHQFSVQQQALRSYIGMDAVIRDEMIFGIWYGVHHEKQPALQWLTAILRKMNNRRWMRSDVMMSIMTKQHMPVTRQQWDGWLQRLHRAGWIDMGTDDGGNTWVRRKESDRVSPEKRTLYIQQDDEIVALPQTSYSVIRMLHQIAERLPGEGIQRYRVTKESLTRAFDLGWNARSVLRFLSEYSVDEPGPSLITTIEGWQHNQAKVHIKGGFLIQATHERALMILQIHSEQLRLKKLGDHYWFAEGIDERELSAQLAKLDIHVTVPDGRREIDRCESDRCESDRCESDQSETDPSGTDWSESIWSETAGESFEHVLAASKVSGEVNPLTNPLTVALHPQTPGFFKPQDVSSLYRPEEPVSIAEEVYPDYGAVPKMWYEQYRKYHPTTAKHLLEQAIRWKTRVRLQSSGTEYECIPLSIEQTGGQAIVSAKNGTSIYRLEIGQIDKLQMMLPWLS